MLEQLLRSRPARKTLLVTRSLTLALPLTLPRTPTLPPAPALALFTQRRAPG